MSKVTKSPQLNNVPDDKKWEYATKLLTNILEVLNSKVELTVNVVSKKVSYTFESTNANYNVSHGLGFTPNGYILVGSSVALNIYDGDLGKNNVTISLKSSAIGRADILFF